MLEQALYSLGHFPDQFRFLLTRQGIPEVQYEVLTSGSCNLLKAEKAVGRPGKHGEVDKASAEIWSKRLKLT